MPANQPEARSDVFILSEEIASLEGKVSNTVELGQKIKGEILNSLLTDAVPKNKKLILDLNGSLGLGADFLEAAFSGLSASFNKAVQEQGLLSNTNEPNILDYLSFQAIDLQLLWEVGQQIRGTSRKPVQAELTY